MGYPIAINVTFSFGNVISKGTHIYTHLAVGLVILGF